MSNPKVSVVMPTFNAEQYLRTSIKSILNQSFTDFELIIVDDGSTDNTIATIKEFEDNRITLIERKDKSGVTSARNRGIREAQGEFIAQHDADDYSDQTRFQRQVDYLDSHPDVAMVGTGANLVNERKGVTERRRVEESPSLDDLLQHNHYIQGSVMIRASALESVGYYDERFPVTEDYDLWLRLAKKFEVRNIDEPLYNFRIHQDSLYSDTMEKIKLYHQLARLRVTNRVSEERFEELVGQDFPEEVCDELSANERFNHHQETAQELLRYDNPVSSRRHAKQALKTKPLSIKPILLIILSYFPQKYVYLAESYYRKLLNYQLQNSE